MNRFTFKNYNWKVFGNVNSGRISEALKVKPEHRSRMFGFLHNTLGIMNFTSKNAIISFEIKETATGYTMVIDWTTTKLKSETTLQYLADVRNNVLIPDHTTTWRNAVKSDLQDLVKNYSRITYRCKYDSSEYLATLECDITYDKLYEFPKGPDVTASGFNTDPQKFAVPHHLIKNIIQETIQEAIKYFGSDHQKLFDILEPLAGKEFYADYLIGATYFLFLNQPNKALAYFERALKNIEKNELHIPDGLLDFMADIHFVNKSNPKEAEQLLIRSLMIGNSAGILKLAYIYLQQAQSDKQEIALAFAQMGEQILELEEDDSIKKAGYHIIASVYLWNSHFQEAERIHVRFLSDQSWCMEYKEIINSYLILAVAHDNNKFLTNLATDHLYLTKEFSVLFDIWQFKNINPFDKRFQGEFMQTLNLVALAKKLYLL